MVPKLMVRVVITGVDDGSGGGNDVLVIMKYLLRSSRRVEGLSLNLIVSIMN